MATLLTKFPAFIIHYLFRKITLLELIVGQLNSHYYKIVLIVSLHIPLFA
jgi:hypothetical protein